MFDDILHIFDFLSPSRTEQQHQARKPMAIPLESGHKKQLLCKKLFTELDAAEAEVLNDILDPETAWPLLCRIRQLRRETQQDFASLSPASQFQPEYEPGTSPVRIVKTQTGAQLTVFNGGRCH